MDEILAFLLDHRDPSYGAFAAKLLPTVAPETILGVRTPVLRAYAKRIAGSPLAAAFLEKLPHGYYEENQLHAFLLEREREFDRAIAGLTAFLPCVDNWSTCDCMRPKVLKKQLPALLPYIWQWLASGQTYVVRYAIGLLMSFYLDDAFRPEYPQAVGAVRSEEYYVNMMIAWYFATALAKQYDTAVVYLQENRLDRWVHNKTIQKAIESFRIDPERKQYLRTLRRK